MNTNAALVERNTSTQLGPIEQGSEAVTMADHVGKIYYADVAWDLKHQHTPNVSKILGLAHEKEMNWQASSYECSHLLINTFGDHKCINLPESLPSQAVNSFVNYYWESFILPEAQRPASISRASSVLWYVRKLLCKPESIKSKVLKGQLSEELLQTIVDAFQPFEKVHAVYVQRFRSEIQINILLAIDKYDDSLMDSLLDAEYEVRRAAPDLILAFDYSPVGVVVKNDFMHPSARAIFSR